MEPKTIAELYRDWVIEHKEETRLKNVIQERLVALMKDAHFDFGYFKLKKEVHSLKKQCDIYGIAHDWIATYPDSEWSKYELLDVRFNLEDVKDGVLPVEIVYTNGEYNHADIPLSVLGSEEEFTKWYDIQLANYKDNKEELANYIRKQDEAVQSVEFKRWLTSGDKFVQLGLVYVSQKGHDVLK